MSINLYKDSLKKIKYSLIQWSLIQLEGDYLSKIEII